MKYAPELYAEAFTRALNESAAHVSRDALVARLLAVIEKNGDNARKGKILNAVRRAFIKKRGGREISIETARDQHIDLGRYFKKEDEIETRVNPDLIAGLRITVDGERELDTSLHRKLSRMFQ